MSYPVEGVRWGAPAAARPVSRVVGIAFVILTILALAPLALAKMPFMIDYANNLAGLYTIAHYKGDPLLAQYYYANWKLVPNLAMDLFLYPFAQVMDIYLLGKLFIAFTVIVLVTGGFAVERAIYQRTTVWPLTAFLFVYCDWMVGGTLNYMLGLGFALYGIAVYIAQRDQPVLRFLISLAFCALLFVVHLFDFGLYGLALFSFELWYLSANRVPRTWLTRFVIMGLPFLLVLPLFLLSPAHDYAGANGTEWSLHSKLQALYSTFRIYLWRFDLPFLVLSGIAAVWAVWSKRLQPHAIGWIMLALSVPIFVVMPETLLGSWGADVRFPTGVLFVVLGMCAFEFRNPAHRIGFAALVVALMAYRMTSMVLVIKNEFVPVTEQMDASFAMMEPGKKVLATWDLKSRDRIGWQQLTRIQYAPTLAMIERSAFVSEAFAHPAHHVLAVREPYRHIAQPEGIPVDINEVLTSTDPNEFWSTWRTDFDYVYVLYPTAVVSDPHLQLVYRGWPFFDLYKVVH